MPPVGFEHKISVGEWAQTYALDRAATETDLIKRIQGNNEGEWKSTQCDTDFNCYVNKTAMNLYGLQDYTDFNSYVNKTAINLYGLQGLEMCSSNGNLTGRFTD
jgi:hypothetical protein